MWWISVRNCILHRYSAAAKKDRNRSGQRRELKFLGFGTMNGKDGKPFKTREGGVMRLETSDFVKSDERRCIRKSLKIMQIEEEEARTDSKNDRTGCN